jgi:hypothetical protein
MEILVGKWKITQDGKGNITLVDTTTGVLLRLGTDSIQQLEDALTEIFE